MKRVMFVSLICFCLLFGSIIIAQQRDGTIGTPPLKVKLRQLPDLTVVDIWAKKDTCRLWVRYQNLGGSIGMVVLREIIEVNGNIVGDSKYTQPMPPNGYFAHGVQANPGYIVSGTIKVTVKADVDNDLLESNETNNSLTKTVTCNKSSLIAVINPKLLQRPLLMLQPDLKLGKIIKIGEQMKEVKNGGTIILRPKDAESISNGIPAFNFYYTMKNVKGGPAKNFENKIFFNGKMISHQTNLTLDKAPDKEDIHTQGYLPLKNGRLTIMVDSENDISESKENNNKISVNVVFKGKGFGKKK